MSLVLYYAPFSSASTVHAACEELGIPYEKVRIDLQKGEQKKLEFVALNPNAKVPTLVHDGTPIFESVAILIHLGETYGVDKGLFPKPGIQRALATQWLVWANVSLGEALARYNRNMSERFPKEQQNARAGETARADVETHLGILDKALAGKTNLVGSSYSLVDTHLGGWAHYVGMCGFDLKRWPNLDAYVKSTTSRPSYAKAMKPDA